MLLVCVMEACLQYLRKNIKKEKINLRNSKTCSIFAPAIKK